MMDQLDSLTLKIAVLASALDYYARPQNYYGPRYGSFKPRSKSPNVLSDGGKRARQALEQAGLIRQ